MTFIAIVLYMSYCDLKSVNTIILSCDLDTARLYCNHLLVMFAATVTATLRTVVSMKFF